MRCLLGIIKKGFINTRKQNNTTNWSKDLVYKMTYRLSCHTPNALI